MSSNARLAAAARNARLSLASILAETVEMESRDGRVNCEPLLRAHSAAFNAASAAAHLPSGAACMVVVEEAEAQLNAWGMHFNQIGRAHV